MMELKGKKVLVVGLGKSGLAAALFLRRRGAQVTVSDIRSAEALAKDIPALLEEGINVEAGGHGLLTFRRQDLIVVSPGVPLETPELVQAQAASAGPSSANSSWPRASSRARSSPSPAPTARPPPPRCSAKFSRRPDLPTLVGGNIGVPVVALIEESTDDTWSVLEVSSFQLETTEQFHPAIAVILNITPDHLDRHGTFENYALAKERIFAAQDEQRFRRAQCRQSFAPQRPPSAPERRSTGSRSSIRSTREHGSKADRSCSAPPKTPLLRPSCRSAAFPSRANTTSKTCSPPFAPRASPEPQSKRSARASKSFKAVEHRLEYVATLNGVEIYNDSKATNVDATAKAIAAFPAGIHLILGGKDKNSDYTQLSDLLRARVRAVYTIGSAAAKIESQLRGVVSIHSCETLDKAVSAVAAAAHPGDVVLLAPACSSFDQFESYEHRGRVFKELVNEWRGWKVWQNV